MRSNHYLSNIVGLDDLVRLPARARNETAAREIRALVNREIFEQTYADGGDCEASTGYHLLVAQMFLHSLVVQQRSGAAIPAEFENRLRRMFLGSRSCRRCRKASSLGRLR